MELKAIITACHLDARLPNPLHGVESWGLSGAGLPARHGMGWIHYMELKVRWKYGSSSMTLRVENPLHGVERTSPASKPSGCALRIESITWSWKSRAITATGETALFESITWSWKNPSCSLLKIHTLLVNPLHGVERCIKSGLVPANDIVMNPLHGVERFWSSTCRPPPTSLGIHYMELKEKQGVPWLRLRQDLGNPLHGVESCKSDGVNAYPLPIESITWSWKSLTLNSNPCI